MLEINQSLIKAFLHKGQIKDYCARKVYNKYFLNKDVEETSLSQLRGIYFENNILGGEKITLPTKRNGEPTIDTLRINEQINNFPNIIVEKLMFVNQNINTQILLKKKFGDVIIKGKLDWFPTFFLLEGDLKVAIVDVKLTKDMNSTWGDFCWGLPENLDWIQAAFYHYLVQDIDYDLNNHLTGPQQRLIRKFSSILDAGDCIFIFLVFDYKQGPEYKYIQVEWNYDKFKYLENSVQRTIDEIEYNKGTGWKPTPSTENCKSCLLECPVRQIIAKI